MRNKFIITGLSMLLAVSLAGCSLTKQESSAASGSSTQESTAASEMSEAESSTPWIQPEVSDEETAEMFLTAYQMKDTDKLQELADENVISGLTIQTDDQVASTLYEALGVQKGEDEDVDKAVADLASYIASGQVRQFTVDTVTRPEETKAYAQAAVTHGPGTDVIGKIDISDEMQSLSDTYASEHTDELVDIYNKEGEDALASYIRLHILPDALSVMKQKMSEAAAEDYQMYIEMTLENGAWHITDAVENKIGETSEAN